MTKGSIFKVITHAGRTKKTGVQLHPGFLRFPANEENAAPSLIRLESDTLYQFSSALRFSALEAAKRLP